MMYTNPLGYLTLIVTRVQVSELQQQLAQIQTHTMEKLQDFDDTIEEYQSKVVMCVCVRACMHV